MKQKIPTMKELKEYRKYLDKEAKKFKLTQEDLSNLFDMFYMLDDDTYRTIKLNKMGKWFNKFRERIEEIVIPESYSKNKK
ncbi:hypothetical protein LCGC14_0784110 [marine sediment metagenome]|uniref:Uncharacterized protein n=1 Tax=marine sediment metagenome TaxID=412755 RepID=A0A0F9PYU8_9ZZZZ